MSTTGHVHTFFIPWRNSPQCARASLISRLYDHTQLYTPHSVGLLWMSDHPDAETTTWQHTTLATERKPCPGAIRTHNPKSERPHTHALDRSATGVGTCIHIESYKNMGEFIWKISRKPSILGVGRGVVLQCILEKFVVALWTGVGWFPVTCFCKYSGEPSVDKKQRNLVTSWAVTIPFAQFIN